MDTYGQLGRPYVEHHHLSSDFNYAFLMNPWMAEVFSMSDFIEIDITFKVSLELSYLLNVVTFDYHTCKCKWHFLCMCAHIYKPYVLAK